MFANRTATAGALLLLLLAVSVSGQDRPLFSSVSELVVLHATITDRRGAYVRDLTRDAFTILEDGRPQVTQLFTSEDAPVTVGLLIDSSGSMQPHRDRVVAAAAAFAQANSRGDELFALAFNDTVTPVLAPQAPFTNDMAALQRAITNTTRTQGRTALFDAVATGLDYVAHGRHERKVLVVVSDGGDNASRTTLDDVIARTRSSNAVIYTVALDDPVDGDANPKLLKRLAQATGGRAFSPKTVDEIATVLQRIAADIRHTYTLGYISTNQTRNGSFRSIRLVVRPPDGRSLLVRTRSGYVASISAAARYIVRAKLTEERGSHERGTNAQ